MDDDSSAAHKKRGFSFRCVGADSPQVYLRIGVVSVSCMISFLIRYHGKKLSLGTITGSSAEPYVFQSDYLQHCTTPHRG